MNGKFYIKESKKMKAKKPKEIREEVRKQMAARHKQEVEDLKRRVIDWQNRYAAAKKELAAFKDENLKLKEKVEVQKDWIERLMEFMDMPEDKRHDTIEKYLHDGKVTEDFYNMFNPYFKVLNRLSLLKTL